MGAPQLLLESGSGTWAALRVRIWYRKGREFALMCGVYNIKKAAEQEIPINLGD